MIHKNIVSNKIQCKHCGDIIESKTVHDYKTCKCGKVSVDGGLYYLKRRFPSLPVENHLVDLSEVEEIEVIETKKKRGRK